MAGDPRIEVIPPKDAGMRPFDKRMATHSHIKGLGLALAQQSDQGEDGFVGQLPARMAMSCILSIARERKMAGRAILLVGPSGTGKTALALGLSQELGPKVPFTALTGPEVFSSEVKKTEVLMENFRRSIGTILASIMAIGLTIREIKEVYEGEVTMLTPVEADNPFGGFGRSISHILVTLKATKGTKQLRLDPSLYESFQRERIAVGDVIYIESASGTVKRVGRSESFANEFDLEADEYVPIPKGEVLKKKELLQQVTLHDLDAANAMPAAHGASLANPQLMMPWRKTEITERLRTEVNKVVNEYIDAGTAELVPGVLFIDEAHMLDLECFAYLNRAIESPISPLLVLATNRGLSEIRGTCDKVLAAHGMPSDLLDRLVIVPTAMYTQGEIEKIVAIRAKMEGVDLDTDALHFLAEIGSSTSLRHHIAPLFINAEIESTGPVVRRKDIESAKNLFIDAGRSMAHVKSTASH